MMSNVISFIYSFVNGCKKLLSRHLSGFERPAGDLITLSVSLLPD